MSEFVFKKLAEGMKEEESARTALAELAKRPDLAGFVAIVKLNTQEGQQYRIITMADDPRDMEIILEVAVKATMQCLDRLQAEKLAMAPPASRA